MMDDSIKGPALESQPDLIPSRESSFKPAPSWGRGRISRPSLPLNGIYQGADMGGAGVSVYLVDTGIDYEHQELTGRARQGYDAFGKDGGDELGNGTFLAGVIAAIAPQAVLYSVKVLDGQGHGSMEGILAAIDWISANARKPAVVNVAIGIPPHEALDDAIRASITAGITYVIEGGGASEDVMNSSPSRVREGIVVGASDPLDRMADYSNFGAGIDVFAPGDEITSTACGGGMTMMSGVQVAAAHVTGVAALHLSRQRNMTPPQVKQKIIREAAVGVLTNVPKGTPNRLLQVRF